MSSISYWFVSRPCIRFVFFVERWLLSALMLYLGYEYLDTLRLMRLLGQSVDLMPQALVARDAGLVDGVHFEDLARYSLLAFSNLACGFLLLIARKPMRYPDRAHEVVIPLLATFFYLCFNQRTPLPAWMTTPLIPTTWTTPLAAGGLTCSVVGVIASTVCILCLGRSMGIVVSVRKVKLNGPYRYVRHPIYLSYALIFLGLFLTACTVRMGLLIIGAYAMLCWRARLEETFLAAHSPAYREWMARTGFLWPRWSTVKAPEPWLGTPAPRPFLSSIPEMAATD